MTEPTGPTVAELRNIADQRLKEYQEARGRLQVAMAGDMEALAETAYEAYLQAVNFISVRGEPLPLWEYLHNDSVRNAWIRAATAVAERIRVGS